MPDCPHNELISVLILNCPGLMRNSLQTLFSAVPRVQITGMFNQTEITLEKVIALQPNCIVLESEDGQPGPSSLNLLAGLKQAYPQTCCLIITPSPNQARLFLAAGADYVLLKGFAFGELKQAFDLLFSPNPQVPDK